MMGMNERVNKGVGRVLGIHGENKGVEGLKRGHRWAFA